MGPVILRAAVMLALGVAVWSQAPRPASLHKITSELSSDVLTAGAQPQQQALSDVGAAATSEAGAGDAVAGDAAADTDATATTSGTGPNLIRTGLMKSTWPVSSPLNTSYPFLMKYLPVYDNTDSCADNACTCGEQGRVSLNTNDASPHSFALHTVAARGAGGARWAASGRLSVEDVEQIVGEELGDLSAGDVSPWLDFATALWAPTLYPYLKAFAADGVPHLRLRWRAAGTSSHETESGTKGSGALLIDDEYYSLLVRVPETMVVLELISNTTGSSGGVSASHYNGSNLWQDDWASWAESTDEVESGFQPYDTPRHLWFGAAAGSAPPAGLSAAADVLVPLHLSRPVANLTAALAWYKAVLGEAAATPVSHVFGMDGSETAALVVPPAAGVSDESPVQIQLVQRPRSASLGLSSARRPTRWLSEYLADASRASGMASGGAASGCWPVWGDLHAGFNNLTATTAARTLDEVAAALDAVGGQHYAAFVGVENGYDGYGHTALNVLDPSTGFELQLGGVYRDPPAGATVDWGNFEGYCFTDRSDGAGAMQFSCAASVASAASDDGASDDAGASSGAAGGETTTGSSDGTEHERVGDDYNQPTGVKESGGGGMEDGDGTEHERVGDDFSEPTGVKSSTGDSSSEEDGDGTEHERVGDDFSEPTSVKSSSGGLSSGEDGDSTEHERVGDDFSEPTGVKSSAGGSSSGEDGDSTEHERVGDDFSEPIGIKGQR